MKPSCLLLAAAAVPVLLAALPARADEPQPLETVVVTTTRSEQGQVRLPASVRIITAAEIVASGAHHLVDALRLAGGLQLTDFYGDGSRAQVDARAFGDAANANTLVLVDGRRLNNPDIAAPDLNAIALADVERIEIIEGSAGALYGDQATGGVVNIVTRSARDAGLRASASGGSFGRLGAQAALSAPAGPARVRLSLADRGADNYRDHNHLESRHALGSAGVDWEGGGGWLELGYVEEDLETPGTLFADEMAQDRRQSAAAFAGDFSDTETRHHRVGLSQALGDWQLVLEHTRRASDGVFRLSSAAFGPAGAGAQQARKVSSLNPRLTGALPLAGRDALLTVGVDYQRAEYLLQSQFGAQDNEQRQADAYGQAIVPLPGAVDLTLGARSARLRNHVYDGYTFSSPTTFVDDQTAAQLGLSWRPRAGLRLYARGDRNFRYAKVDEFTFTSAAAGSNDNLLRTQQGDSLEAGAEWAGGDLALAGSLFRLDTDDEIAYDPTGGPFGFGANLNLPSTRRDGALLRAQWQAGLLQLAASGQYVDAEVTQGNLAGRDIPLAAARIGQASATLQLPAGLDAQLGLRYTGARALAGDFDNSLGRLPAHAVVHLALGWQWRALALRARIDNLLDREYSEYGVAGLDAGFNEAPAYLPSPERAYSLALQLAL